MSIFSCFHSSCQLGLNPLTGKKCDITFSPVILWLTFYCAMSNCQILDSFDMESLPLKFVIILDSFRAIYKVNI